MEPAHLRGYRRERANGARPKDGTGRATRATRQALPSSAGLTKHRARARELRAKPRCRRAPWKGTNGGEAGAGVPSRQHGAASPIAKPTGGVRDRMPAAARPTSEHAGATRALPRPASPRTDRACRGRGVPSPCMMRAPRRKIRSAPVGARNPDHGSAAGNGAQRPVPSRPAWFGGRARLARSSDDCAETREAGSTIRPAELADGPSLSYGHDRTSADVSSLTPVRRSVGTRPAALAMK